MLPGSLLINKARWFWIALVALSPLAYLAGASLILKNDPTAGAGFAIDRQFAIGAASQFLSARGIDVTGWDNFCRVNPENLNDLHFYYKLKRGRDAETASSLAPEIIINVRLRSPDRAENIEVDLSTDGRILGYARNISKNRDLGTGDEATARRLAEEAVKARADRHELGGNVDLKLTDSAEDGIVVRRFTWDWPLREIPEMKIRSQLAVRGGVLISDRIEAKLDPDFAGTHLHSKPAIRVIFAVVYGLLVLVVLIFGIYRFVQRVKQKELSSSRIALVSVIFTSVMVMYIMLTDVALYPSTAIPDSPIPDWWIAFFASMIYVVMGMFMGLAYGSGEGDIRESYPGKLTSLDALITGKVISKNVSRSALLGCAIGGWVAICINLVVLPWLGKPGYGEELGPMDQWIGYAPWLAALFAWPMDVFLITVIGLLIPLPLFNRRFSSQRLIFALTALLVWIAASAPYLGFRPWVGLLLIAAVRTLFFLLAFFYFDLLAAMASLAAPTFFAFALNMTAQPSPTIRNSGYISLAIAGGSILIAFFFAFKGRFFTENEVRPVYAKLLAQRIDMKAEVAAAREAQKRLMPEHTPEVPGFSVAACCLPAYEVGGDYYEVFKLDDDKLGVLIAEGGGKGLGSALSIAFAKGFLMPKIMGGYQADNSPTEVIRSLQDRLTSLLDGDEGVGLAFAVIDATDGSLRYSRVGPNPTVMVAGSGSPDELSMPEERVVAFKSNRGPGGEVRVIEGRCSLSQGDSVILFTDGIVKELTLNKTTPGAEFGRLLMKTRDGGSESLQDALAQEMSERSRRAKKKGLDDDLTAVIVKLDAGERSVAEGSEG